VRGVLAHFAPSVEGERVDNRVSKGHAAERGVFDTAAVHSRPSMKSVRAARGLEVPARGFSVERKLFPGGLVESSGSPLHVVSVLAGAPVRVDCRRGGRHYVGLFKRGDIEIVPKGESGRWIDEGPADLIIMRIDPGFLNKVAASMGFDPKAVELLPRIQARDAQIEHLAWALEAALAESREVEPMFVQGLGVALASRLIKEHAVVRLARVARALSRRQTADVLDHIDAHLGERLTLAQLARFVGVSASHFKGLFKAAVGVPAHRYVMRRRVARAVELIQAGGLPLAKVAAATGFAHQSHLARAMRAVVGRTPGELAREAR
jgi:AraC family transcriptional regulator